MHSRRHSPHRATALLVCLLALAASAAGVERTGDASASFTGKAVGVKLEGKTSELKLQDDGQVLRVIVPLAGLKTGMDLRDKHMREKYLEVDKYPDAVLEVPWSAVTLPEDGKSTTQKGRGKMTLHGRTKEVPFTYTVHRAGNTYQVTGNTPLNLKDFGIEVPSYLGVTVKPDIETVVSFSAKKG